MSGVNIEYKGESIATIPDTGSKTIKTQGKYCEGDILVEYEAPPTPQPTLITKQITENGTYAAEDDNADGYREVEVDIQPLFTTQGVMYFKDMIIPNTVSTVKSGTYAGCIMMETLEIAGSVTSISTYAFQNCHINSLVLHNGIQTILSNAFLNHRCVFVEIPDSVTRIGDSAFASSTVVGQVYDLSNFLDPTKIPALDNINAFIAIRTQSFLVANQEMLNAFESATNWSAYAGKYVIKGATP